MSPEAESLSPNSNVSSVRNTRKTVVIFGLATVLALSISIAGGAQVASAATYTGGKWWDGNVTYYNATLVPYSAAFTAGKNNWNTSSDLNFTGDTSAKAMVRVSTLSRSDNTLGITEFTKNGLGFFVGQTKVYFNTYNSASSSANCKRMTITHELGHAVGLGHRDGAYIMRSTAVDCQTRYNPQSGDIAAIDSLY